MGTSWHEKVKEFKSPARVLAAILLRSRETLSSRIVELNERIAQLQFPPDSTRRGPENSKASTIHFRGFGLSVLAARLWQFAVAAMISPGAQSSVICRQCPFECPTLTEDEG